MKKSITFILLLLILVVLGGCGRPKCLIGANSKIEENDSFNHYDFTSFKGEYDFSKEVEDNIKLRLVLYTTSEYNLTIIIKKDNNDYKEISVNESNNGTYYYELEKGKYDFSLVANDSFKGELLFGWNSGESDE